MNSFEGVRHVSAYSKAAIGISAAVALILLIAFLGHLNNLLTDAAPISLDIWVRGEGASKTAARDEFTQSRSEALDFLANAGFHSSEIERDDFAMDRSPMRSGAWEASQRLTVSGTSYARFSTLSNDVSKIDPSGRRISASFPPIPFEAAVVWVGTFTIILLCVSVTSVDFRAADVSAAPRGMHGVVIASQTLLYAAAIMSAVMYVHVNALVARTGFIFVAVCIIASIGVWLFRTRPYWRQSSFLSRAYVGYVACGVVVAFSLLAAILKGPA